MSFMRGDILSIPTAANENAIKASWMIILGVCKDGIGVPFSAGSICNMGSSTMGTPICVLAVVLTDLSFSCNFFASSLFSCLVSLALSGCAPLYSGDYMRCLSFFLSFELLGLEFPFLALFLPPSEFDIGAKNSLTPSVFSIGVGGWVGMIPGVLLRVTRACTLCVARMLA